MRLLFRQRMFSWFDSYDIYDSADRTVYTVKGQPSWGHCLRIFDPSGEVLGTVQQKVLMFLPKFELYGQGRYIGCIRKLFSPFHPRYVLDGLDWYAEGNWIEWDYTIRNGAGNTVATVSKQPLHWTDTYVIDTERPEDALYALMFVLAVDAEKCSRS